MSMPTFPELPDNSSFEGSINQILLSIALEEVALSHIINAEGEKIQYVLGTIPGIGGAKPSIDEVLEVNESVKDMLSAISMKQILLLGKMSMAMNLLDLYFKNSNKEEKPDDKDDNGEVD